MRQFLFTLGYVGTSIWGILILVSIITDPYTINLNNSGIVYFTGAVFGMILIMTGPLGIVFALDRHLQKEKLKHAVL